MRVIQSYLMRLSLMLVFAGLAAACNLVNTPSPVPARPSEVNPPDTPNTFTAAYTDNDIGFTFSYPEGWTMQAEPGRYAILFSYQPDPNDGGDSIVEGAAKMDFILLPTNATLDSAVSNLKSEQDATIVSEKHITLSSGVQAVRLQSNSARVDSVPVLLANINGRIMMIVGYGDSTQFDAIVGTLRAV